MATSKTVEPVTRKPMALTLPQQRVPPCAAHFATEAFKGLQIPGDSVVVEVALHQTLWPLPHDIGRFMPTTRQRVAEGAQRRPHPLLSP
jgi:hypothetical protein